MRNFARLPRAVVRTLERHPIALLVYVHLLTRARFVPGVVSSGHGDVLRLEIGEAVFGYDEMARLCGATSRTTIRAATDRLQKLGILVIRSNNRGSIARLLNFRENDDDDSREVTADPTADPTAERPQAGQQTRQQTDPNKKGKKAEKGKKEKKGERESLPLNWSPRGELSEKAKAEGLTTDEIASEWQKFVNHCRSKAIASADWNAEADTWITRAIDYKRNRPGGIDAVLRIARGEPPRRVPNLDDVDRKRTLDRIGELAAKELTPMVAADLKDAIDRAANKQWLMSFSIGDSGATVLDLNDDRRISVDMTEIEALAAKYVFKGFTIDNDEGDAA